MKKFLTLTLVVLALVFVLASCGNDTPTQPTIPTTTQPQGTEPPVHEHDYETIVTDPTCTEQGVVLYICACGDKYTEYIDALRHIESDWIIDVEPTTTQEGSKHTECTVCGQPIKTETIDKLPSTTSAGLEFTLNDDGQSYSVTGIGTCTDTDIVIPSEYNDLPVTSISEFAFRNRSSLTSIVIPDSVTSIGEGTFCYCTSLTSVTFGENSQLTSIGYGAFVGCSSLTIINIPDSVISIGSDAFAGCTSLTIINIPDSVTSIGARAFGACTLLTSIEVDENNAYYKSIDGNLYDKDVKTLIQYATGKKDTRFVIPDSVTTIDNYAFFNCTSLTSVTVGNSVTSIGGSAFKYCTSLTNITFGENSKLTSIGDWAFLECTSLTSINIPNSVTSIGLYTFGDCTSLTSINIPKSVTSISLLAFDGCTSLTIYCEAESQPSGWASEWNLSNCPVVWGYKPE